jgi:hypothetical protein
MVRQEAFGHEERLNLLPQIAGCLQYGNQSKAVFIYSRVFVSCMETELVEN